MSLWVEIPAGVSEDGTTYFWDVTTQNTSREKPSGQSVQWLAARAESGQTYYWNRLTHGTSWNPPTSEPVKQPPGGPFFMGPKVSSAGIRPENGWVFDVYHDFNLPEQPEGGHDDEDSRSWPDAGNTDVNSAWVEVDRPGGRRYFWNFRRQISVNELPAGVRCTYVAAWHSQFGCYYYHDKLTGDSEWTSPMHPTVEPQALPRWLEIGVAVTVDGLTKDQMYNDMEGRFIGTDSTGAALVQLSDNMGGLVLSLKLGCLRPLKKSRVVELTNLQSATDLNGKVGTVEAFDEGCTGAPPPNSQQARYLVKLANSTKSIRATKVTPRCRIWDLSIIDAPRWLQWRQSEKEYVFIDSEGQHRKCHLHLPLDFADRMRDLDQRRLPKWPLLVYLHGAGGGSFFVSSKKALKSDGQQFAAKRFVVLSPACDWKWTEVPKPWVNEVIAYLRTAPFIDHRRVYLTGCSMGGMGTWEIAASSPQLFAAIAPVAAHHQAERRHHITRQLHNMPIFVVHSRFDETCPLSSEQSLWTGLLAFNSRLQVNMTDQVDHCSMFEKTFCDSTVLYERLLRFRQPV